MSAYKEDGTEFCGVPAEGETKTFNIPPNPYPGPVDEARSSDDAVGLDLSSRAVQNMAGIFPDQDGIFNYTLMTAYTLGADFTTSDPLKWRLTLPSISENGAMPLVTFVASYSKAANATVEFLINPADAGEDIKFEGNTDKHPTYLARDGYGSITFAYFPDQRWWAPVQATNMFNVEPF